jgi:hypothetical protein
MANSRGTIVTLLLLAAVIAAAVAIDAPWAAIPIVFLIVFVWGGGRMANARGRTS